MSEIIGPLFDPVFSADATYATVQVIRGLLLIASFWLVWLVVDTSWLWGRVREIKRASDVSELKDDLETLLQRLKQHEVTDTVDISDSELRLKSFFSTPSISIKPTGPVGQHISAIFYAGLRASKLDVGQLLMHSTNKLLRTNSVLQSLLGIFLVVGLLGTLIGLREVLPALGAFVGSADTNALQVTLREELSRAFAPSIVGVGVTVVGIVLLSLRSHLVCAPCQTLLEERTLTVWVPAFLPSAPQRWEQTVVEVGDQIATNAEAVGEVSSLVEKFQRDRSQWEQTLDAATAQMQQLESTASDLRQATSSFSTVVPDLKHSHEALQSAFEAFGAESQKIRVWVGDESERVQDRQDAIQKAVKQIEAVAVAAKAQGEATVQALGDPLKAELATRLETLNQTMRAQSMGITSGLKTLDAPLRATVDKLEAVIVNMRKGNEHTYRQLQEEFSRQNQANAERTDELTAQRETLTQLLSAVEKLLAANETRTSHLFAEMRNLSDKLRTHSVVGVGDAWTSVQGIRTRVTQRIRESLKRTRSE